MKFTIAVFALAGFALTQTFAAPATEPQVEAVETADDAHVSTDVTSVLVEANEAIEETNRAKKSTGPRTVCFEMKDVQGTSYLQCAQSADSESEGTSLYPQYSAAPPSSGYGSAPSSGYGSAPSYKVN
jgi:hypothetical protein